MTIPVCFPGPLKKKCRAIEELLSPHNRVALAFSGGVDSSFLAWLLVHAFNKDLLPVLIRTSFVSLREHHGALRVADEIGLRVLEMDLKILDIPEVKENSTQRCYYCKRELLTRMSEAARSRQCTLWMDGSNADDDREHRPGRRALTELGVLSPLAAAGLSKLEIRELSRRVELSTWDKPSESCLATRIPYGTPLIGEDLSRVERAEAFLWDMGCKQVRARVHGDLVRLELDPESFPILMNPEVRRGLVSRIHSMGFRYVSLDLAGFRSGGWDDPPSNRVTG